jgi:hypothetical protein
LVVVWDSDSKSLSRFKSADVCCYSFTSEVGLRIVSEVVFELGEIVGDNRGLQRGVLTYSFAAHTKGIDLGSKTYVNKQFWSSSLTLLSGKRLPFITHLHIYN